MRLNDLTEFIENILPKINSTQGDTLTGDDLKLILPLLQQTEEFKNVKEIIVMDSPEQRYEDDYGESYFITSKTFKVPKENFKFKYPKMHLYSIGVTPKMYNPNIISDAFKDNKDYITPVIYHPEEFYPIKKIVLNVPVELQGDVKKMNEENGNVVLKNLLMSKLSLILDNPEQYEIKGERSIMIRGDFEIEKDDSCCDK